MTSSRGNTRRGADRQNGEEVHLWKDIQSQIPHVLKAINDSSENVKAIHDADKKCADKEKKRVESPADLPTLFKTLDEVSRAGVKINETTGALIRGLMEKVDLLRAMVRAREAEEAASNPRTTSHRAKDTRGAGGGSDLYDFEGGDSPVPSPNPAAPRRLAGSSKGERSDSVPPKFDRSTPATKADSVEPQGGSAAANAMRSKQNFVKNDEVAFKPKPNGDETAEWILGIVHEVKGEGKRRSYKVLDADVDDENHHQKDFSMKAAQMILIPKEGSILPPLEKGTLVLALYPMTTTFYKAEVIGMDGSEKVNLKFEGEDSSNTTQAVVRRYVLGYRE
ncbi:hypothetical protein F5Y16DRAFT_53443 [Xylariaceae sp. FL0255]|nr:hypothetical protein F5Y16DRAFT_53443 [Xylariaceae sp. FL0255]